MLCWWLQGLRVEVLREAFMNLLTDGGGPMSGTTQSVADAIAAGADVAGPGYSTAELTTFLAHNSATVKATHGCKCETCKFLWIVPPAVAALRGR